MKKGCAKCDYTGFAYGNIPCMCVEDSNTKTKDVIPWNKAVKINDVPFQPTYELEIDNQVKPDDPYHDVYIQPSMYDKDHVDMRIFDGAVYTVKLDNNHLNVPRMKKGDIIYYKNKLLGAFNTLESKQTIMVEVALFSSYGKDELQYKLVRINVADITRVIPCNP